MALRYLFNRTISMPAAIDENTLFEDPNNTRRTPLSAVAEAFEDLSKLVNSTGNTSGNLRLKTFCDACSLVSVLFGSLGIAFKFAELEYVSKVDNLMEAAKRYENLNIIIDIDVKNDSVRTPGSNSRNLRRVRQGLDLIRAIFQNFLSSEFCSLKDAASTAYADVCAPYHTWVVRTAAYAGMCALPTREQLLLNLNVTDELAEKEMKRYIKASLPVIQYIDKLYVSRNIGLDW
ncbi:ACD11 homolog protein-like [Impatiens glandulifera]|uniref:ACD11 homolog protein-like n=1 Tax=Impatiens glandulifera TaxID=253017 RepID=UPI001FB0B9FF|nr:ACD11 homolog protein-like [Impatiens glandulifera]